MRAEGLLNGAKAFSSCLRRRAGRVQHLERHRSKRPIAAPSTSFILLRRGRTEENLRSIDTDVAMGPAGGAKTSEGEFWIIRRVPRRLG